MIEEYQSPRRSKLDVHFDLISEMRRKNWPMRSILKHLESEHHLKITLSTLGHFCDRRGISKGKRAADSPAIPGDRAGSSDSRDTPDRSTRISSASTPVRLRKSLGKEGLERLKAEAAVQVAEAERIKAEDRAKYDFRLTREEIVKAAVPQD